jgi:hypothetical protein
MFSEDMEAYPGAWKVRCENSFTFLFFAVQLMCSLDIVQ